MTLQDSFPRAALALVALALAFAPLCAGAAPLARGDAIPAVGIMAASAADTVVTGNGYVRALSNDKGVSYCEVAAWDAAVIWLYATGNNKIQKRWGPFVVRADQGARLLSVGSRFDLIQYASNDSTAITIGAQ